MLSEQLLISSWKMIPSRIIVMIVQTQHPDAGIQHPDARIQRPDAGTRHPHAGRLKLDHCCSCCYILNTELELIPHQQAEFLIDYKLLFFCNATPINLKFLDSHSCQEIMCRIDKSVPWLLISSYS